MMQKKLNEQLQTFRKKAKLNQNQVARMLHVSRQSVSSWETGRNTPDIETVKQLAELYSVSIDELLYGRKQNNLVSNELIGKIILGAAAGGIFVGRGLVMTTQSGRMWVDFLILITIYLNVIMFREVTRRKILYLTIFEAVIFLEMVFNFFQTGIEGQILLIPFLLILLASHAFFIKDKRLFLHDSRRDFKNEKNR